MSRSLVLLAVLSTAACAPAEWVSTDETLYDYDMARRICEEHAEREASRHRRRHEGLGRRPSPGEEGSVYSSEFRRCMKHYGWERRPVTDAREQQPSDSERGPLR